MTHSNGRDSAYDIDPLYLDRWSPRAFSGAAMTEEQLLTLLEAAHWAPSSANQQPWRFIYVMRDTPDWEPAQALLMDGNREWAKDASALVFIVSRAFTGEIDAAEKKPSYTHSFDAGTAWGFLAIQAHLAGFITHGMGGIFHDKISETYKIPEDFRVEAAVAIGTLGDKAKLPEKLQAREVPSQRKPLSSVAFKATFQAN